MRGVLLHYFNVKKTAAESHRIMVEVYDEHALAERTCQKWFARFKSGDFGSEDEELPGQPKKFEDEELEALLGGDCCQTQEELADSLGVTQAAISKRLKAAGYIHHQRRTLPNTINPFEGSNGRKTLGICDQTRGNNFPSLQRSAPCCYFG